MKSIEIIRRFKKHKKRHSGAILISSLFFIMTVISSCSDTGLLSERNKFLPNEISGFGSFLGVYLVVQLSILLVALVLGIFFGKGGRYISIFVHFLWIVNYRDYGFWIVLLLFGAFSLVLHLLARIISISRKDMF